MRILQKIGAAMMVAGLLLVLGGGISIRGGPDGTWVRVNLIHPAGSAALICGLFLSVVAAFFGAKAGPEKDAAIEPSVTNL
jgi:hypothetical protein